MGCAIKTPNIFNTFAIRKLQMITTRKEFFIQVLDQFAETGNDLLQILDDIESGEVQCFIAE